MNIAVIATGGKQYVVTDGIVLNVEKLSDTAKEGDVIAFEEVLFFDNGKESEVGKPTVKGKKVSATVTKAGRAKKIEVVRYKAKSRYLKRRGHRQPFTQVKFEKI